MQAALLTDRAVLAVTGPDARAFLQGLVTADMDQPAHARYAALLTPQGKILFEFLIIEDGDSFLLDCAASAADALKKRLSLYRLRAKVEIAERPDLRVAAVWGGDAPVAEAARIYADPRLPELGRRAIGTIQGLGFAKGDAATYHAHRLLLGVPDSADFPADTVFAIDAGFEELNGVSFRKGCYVGQEVTARMKHRATARRRFFIAEADGAVPAFDTPIMAGTKEIGTLATGTGARALAHVRLDRYADAQNSSLDAGGVKIRLMKPGFLAV